MPRRPRTPRASTQSSIQTVDERRARAQQNLAEQARRDSFTTNGSNPNADFVEENITMNLDPRNATEADMRRQEAAKEVARIANPITAERAAQLEEEFGGSVQATDGVQSTNEKSFAQRAEAGAPLQSAQAGAGGKKGATGFNPEGVSSSSQGFSFAPGTANRQIEELRSIISEPIMRSTVSGNQVIDQEATRERNDELKREIRQLERDREQLGISQDASLRETGIETGDSTPTEQPTKSISIPDVGVVDIPSPPTTDPSVSAAYAPFMQALSEGDTARALRLAQGLLSLNDDSVAESAKESRADLKEFNEKLVDLSTRVHEASIERAEETKIAQENALQLEKTKFDIEQTQLENQQRRQNVQREQRARRIAASLGASADGNGLKFIEDQVIQGEELMSYLQQSRNLASSSFAESARKISEQYRLSSNEADINYDSKNLQIAKNYQDALDTINNTVSMDKKDRREKAQNLLNTFFKEQGESDRARASAQTQINLKAMDMIADEANRRQKSWTQLMQAKTMFGSNMPSYLAKEFAKEFPGLDIEDFASRKTWTEIDSDLDASSSQNVGEAVRLALPESQGLSFAIDRVANKFGKTAGERAEYKAKMTDMILRGAKEEDVKRELKTDYWDNTKGPAKTSHDERQFTLTNTTSLKGLVEQYNLGEGSDGSLGPISSFVQGTLAKAGLSSDQYNNMASVVGNLRATIIKEKYGAAVTPQELALARSFIPEMSDKGPQFITKLNNLHKMTEYLDEKYFAKAAGLPEPKNPFESVMKTNGQQDTYNNDSLMEILNTGAGSSVPSGVSDLVSMGRVTQDFNTPIASRTNGGLYAQKTVEAWGGKHAGVDIAIPQGSGLPAPFSGTVREAGFQDGWGGTVVFVDDAGGEHRISHLSSLDVKPGERINAGQVIAKSGGGKGTKGAGNSTGPHLDWRIRKNGKYIDPLTYTV